MKNKIKNWIKNKEFYKKAKFWKDISPADFFDFEKLRLIGKVYPYTMAGYKRVSNVYELAEDVERKGMHGAFVECGVWRGGCSAVMAYVSEKYESGRKIWLLDSFEGLPEPTKDDGFVAKEYAGNQDEGKLQTIGQCVASLEDVNEVLFDVLKLKEGNIVIEKGWFQDTLPKAKEKIGKISILRLDGDWYESTRVCLDNLYDNIMAGGYVIIDDYGHWEGSKKALGEFLAKRNIKPDLIKIDYTGVYFKKI